MTTLDSAPTPDGGPGWYPDPLGPWQDRYFDGESWSNQVRRAAKSASTAADGSKPPSFLDRVREAPKWLKIAVGAWLVVVVLVAIPGGNSDSARDGSGDKPKRATGANTTTTNQETSKDDVTESQPVTERKPEADEQPAPSAEQRAREALGDNVSSDVAVGDSKVRSVKVNGQLVDITLSTPEGGFEGPSTDDTDGLASAALAKVYEDGDWRGAAYVEFRGGLVDSATGRPLPNAPTVSYRVERNAARQIDWSNEEALFAIDWGIYRGFCHPAIKGC
jgi:hypothetical protein